MKANEKVRKWLDDNELTQREMAHKIGVTDVTFSRFISGNRVLKAPYLVKIAKEMGITVEELVEDDMEDD